MICQDQRFDPLPLFVLIGYMRIYHGYPDIRMTQKLLYGLDIITTTKHRVSPRNVGT